MYNTGNPVPSTALEDMADNAKVFDGLVNKTSGTVTDRLGNTRRSFQQVITDMGFNPVSGSFQSGATITEYNQCLLDESTGTFYSWNGALPKVVAVGSNPATAGGIGASLWVDRTDLMLRSELLNKNKMLTTELCIFTGTASVGEVITTTGYAKLGVGRASWVLTEGSGDVSKTPIGRSDLSLTDGLGRVWSLLHDGTISLEQIGSQGSNIKGSKPANDSWPAFYLAFLMWKKNRLTGQKIKFVATCAIYYCSKPVIITDGGSLESLHILGSFVYYGNNTLTADEISDSAQPSLPAVKDPYVGVKAQLMWWHIDGDYTRYARVSGFDFYTESGGTATYGSFMPHATYCEMEQCRFVGVTYGRYTRDTYFCAFKHVVYNAGASIGTYGEYITPRGVSGNSDNIGSGTSNSYDNIGYLNFYASIHSKNHLYSTFSNCYSEGALTQHAIISQGDKLTFESYGIENMTGVGGEGRILTATGGSKLTVNNLTAVWKVTIGKTEAIAVTGYHPINNQPTTVTFNNLDFSGVLNNCTPIYSDDTAIVVNIAPTYPAVITNYWSGLGKKSTTINKTGNLILHAEYNSAMLTLQSGGTFSYLFSDGSKLRIKHGIAPSSATDGIPLDDAVSCLNTELSSATSDINTKAKVSGRQVWDKTFTRPLWATGSKPTDTWVDAAGSVRYTPV